MDFTKYVKNKDLQITNDDIDIENLTKDLRKGYISENDVTNKIEEVKKTWDPKTTKDYTDLQTSYETAIKDLDAANTSIKTKNLELEMMSKGFNKENFEEISKLRNSLYADEKDDSKAIESIANRFKDTYFKVEERKDDYDENFIKNKEGSKTSEIKITRNTSLSDLKIKK